MCPNTTIYVSPCCYVCVSSYYYVCVLMLLYMCLLQLLAENRAAAAAEQYQRMEAGAICPNVLV
jgi:hypothetical protein